MPRVRPVLDPVTVTLDGEEIEADRGEPIAAALIAAGRWALARSPKFHRPRGPACFRSSCDGCLARVDGVPNVMTCRAPAHDGARIETQNVLGSRENDLLRAADWFFPSGMDHHELGASVPALRRVMQTVARNVAGLGRLPEAIAPSKAAVRRSVDVMIAGAGPAGMAVAVELSDRGRTVEIADEDADWGASLRDLGMDDPGGPRDAGSSAWRDLAARFASTLSSGARFRSRTIATGIYGDDVLLVSSDPGADPSAEIVTARTLVLAPGAHDGSIAFEGNDIPGVLSARAACRLLSHGVAPGDRAVVVSYEGGTAFGASYARRRPGTVVVPLVASAALRAYGGTRVKGVAFATSDGERKMTCDALLVDAPHAPAYELCAQAGAKLAHESRGFRVVAGADGGIRSGVFAAGEVLGIPLEPGPIAAGARAIAESTRTR